jgi:hypothetical protein
VYFLRFGVILRRLRSHIVLQLNIPMLCPHQPALAPDGHGYALHQGALQRAHGAQLVNQSAQQFIKLGRVFMRQQQLAAQHAVAPWHWRWTRPCRVPFWGRCLLWRWSGLPATFLGLSWLPPVV